MARSFSPKECVFCGARVRLTGEHVFADWLAPYLPGGKSFDHTVSEAFTSTSENKTYLSWREGDLQSKGNPKSKTLKIVCSGCNNGWMSRFQDQVKISLLPMLQGNWPETISPWDRRVLAAWAAMYTMVVEFADLKTQTTAFATRERLRLALEPPKGWYVWIGLHQGPLWKMGFNHFAWLRPQIFVTSPNQPLSPHVLASLNKEVQSTGWIVGPVYFQTVSSDIPGFKVDELAFAEEHGLRVVWPSDRLSIERPMKVLDDIAADNASTGLLPSCFQRKTIRRAWENWRRP